MSDELRREAPSRSIDEFTTELTVLTETAGVSTSERNEGAAPSVISVSSVVNLLAAGAASAPSAVWTVFGG